MKMLRNWAVIKHVQNAVKRNYIRWNQEMPYPDEIMTLGYVPIVGKEKVCGTCLRILDILINKRKKRITQEHPGQSAFSVRNPITISQRKIIMIPFHYTIKKDPRTQGSQAEKILNARKYKNTFSERIKSGFCET